MKFFRQLLRAKRDFMQIVYISIRPKVLHETLEYVEHFMSFIHEVIIIVPQSMISAFSFSSKLNVAIVNEEAILGDKLHRFRTCNDHAMKNWLLRSSLPDYRNLGEEFIMADDDNRPLMHIPKEFYILEGKYESYYHDDMKNRAKVQKTHPPYTDYDYAQLETYRILKKNNYETLSYSSHMPQVINREFFKNAVDMFFNEKYKSLDEWNIYFNFSHRQYPTRFNKPKPYTTLCWPISPSHRHNFIRTSDFYFENFYPHLYKKNSIFAGIPTKFDKESHLFYTVQKIKRRLDLEIDYKVAKLSLIKLICLIPKVTFFTFKRYLKQAVKFVLGILSKFK